MLLQPGSSWAPALLLWGLRHTRLLLLVLLVREECCTTIQAAAACCCTGPGRCSRLVSCRTALLPCVLLLLCWVCRCLLPCCLPPLHGQAVIRTLCLACYC